MCVGGDSSLLLRTENDDNHSSYLRVLSSVVESTHMFSL